MDQTMFVQIVLYNPVHYPHILCANMHQTIFVHQYNTDVLQHEK